jgi:AraC-like DNA-binding protein
MRAKLEQLNRLTSEQSFLCYVVNQAEFEFFWHHHPEYELTLITGGQGRRLVGDAYDHFTTGDLVLLGPHLPHTWISDKGVTLPQSAIVIQFTAAFIHSIVQYPEWKAVALLLEQAARGVAFSHTNAREVQQLISAIAGDTGSEAFILLLRILQQLAGLDRAVLATDCFRLLKSNDDTHRINRVFRYVQQQYANTISLKTAAALIPLSTPAFCKFFKKTTGKTFSDYVNDIRIANACQLLLETDKPIFEIAYRTGFESLTYFNRVFLRKKKRSPTAYRQLDKVVLG